MTDAEMLNKLIERTLENEARLIVLEQAFMLLLLGERPERIEWLETTLMEEGERHLIDAPAETTRQQERLHLAAVALGKRIERMAAVPGTLPEDWKGRG